MTKKRTHKSIFTPNDRRRLAVESCCSEHTIRRWEHGETDLKQATVERLTKAAKKLKIPVPTAAAVKGAA